MGKFILGAIVGMVLLPVLVVIYLVSGYAPVAATDAPFPFEETIAKKALHAKVAREMPKSAPAPADEITLAAGARVYRDNCAVCHGLPNQPEPIIAKGMFPHAPQLLMKDGMVADDPPSETYWKAKNGIRLTGMPGFGAALSDEQLWQVSLLLANADKLPPSVQQALAAPTPPATAPTSQPPENKPK